MSVDDIQLMARWVRTEGGKRSGDSILCEGETKSPGRFREVPRRRWEGLWDGRTSLPRAPELGFFGQIPLTWGQNPAGEMQSGARAMAGVAGGQTSSREKYKRHHGGGTHVFMGEFTIIIIISSWLKHLWRACSVLSSMLNAAQAVPI